MSGSSVSPSHSALPSPPDADASTDVLARAVDGPADALVTATRVVLKRRFRVVLLVRDAYEAMTRHRSTFAALRDDLTTIFRLLLAWVDRSYRHISLTPLVLMVAALMYFVLPTDLIPDVLAGIGFVDDLTVITTVLQSVKGELEQFRVWEAGEAESEPLV